MLLISIMLAAKAQEKGHYITVGGGVGLTGLRYDWSGPAAEGENKLLLGGNVQLGYSYFFTPHWGLGTAVSLAYFQSRAEYNRGFYDNEYFNLGQQTADNMNSIDPNMHDYELRARIAGWRENQSVYTFNVPLMLQYQTKFGEKKTIGFYAGAGPKLHFPIRTNYAVQDGKYLSDGRLNISGYFPGTSNIDYGAPSGPPVDQHGFGSLSNPKGRHSWQGDIPLKMSISAFFNTGLIWTLSPKIDLLTGLYIDYGLNNVKKQSKELFKAPANYSASFPPNNSNSIGTGITYSGVVNSQQTNRATLFAGGVELALRFRLHCDKKEKEIKTDTVYKQDTVVVYKKDTVEIPAKETIIYTTSTELAPPYTYRVVVLNSRTQQPIERAEVDMGGMITMLTSRIGVASYRIDQDTLFGTRIRAVGYSDIEIVSQVPKDGKAVVVDTVYLDINSSTQMELNDIYYDFDQYNISPESAVELDRVVYFMQDNPGTHIVLASHTDSRGSDTYNLTLSQRRADAAVAYIVARGIAPSRIVGKGYGETQLRNQCANGVKCSEQQHRVNRRTEISVSYQENTY